MYLPGCRVVFFWRCDSESRHDSGPTPPSCASAFGEAVLIPQNETVDGWNPSKDMANIPGFTRIFDYSKWLEQQDLVPFLLGFQFLAGWNDSNLARILFFQINSFFLQKNSTSVEVVLPPKQASRKKQKRQEVRRFLNGNNFGQSFGDDLLGGQLCVLKECMNVKLPNGNPTSKDAENLISKQIHRYIDEWMFYCFFGYRRDYSPKG